LGLEKFKGDINFTREIASSNARKALIAGVAEIKKINSDKISATI